MAVSALVLSVVLGLVPRPVATARPAAPDAGPEEPLWVARWDGPVHMDERPLAIKSSPDGTLVYVTGQGRVGPGAAGSNYTTLAYDAATGAQVWEAMYDAVGGYEFATANAVAPNGSLVFATGRSGGPGTGKDAVDYATVAYDARTGAERWVARYDGPGNGYDSVTAIVVSEDSTRVFVTGWSAGPNDLNDFATIAYDAATGARLWVATYDGVGGQDEAWNLAVSPDGSRVYVTGRTRFPATDRDYATIAYDAATGDQLWVSTYTGDTDHHDSAANVKVSPDGSLVYITGGVTFEEEGRDFVTIAYEAATGDQRWLARFTGPTRFADTARALVLSPDGTTLYVSGRSTWFRQLPDPGMAPDECPWCPHDRKGVFDYATVAYDALTGAELWVSRFHEGKDADSSPALAVSPGGDRLYLAGLQQVPPYVGPQRPYDIATLAYNTNFGEQVWLDMYDGPAGTYDTADDIAISPDGRRVFVTGRSTGVTGGRDFLTLAYELPTGG